MSVLLLLLLFVDGDDCVLLSLYLVKRPAQHYPVILMLLSKNMSLTLIIIDLFPQGGIKLKRRIKIKD